MENPGNGTFGSEDHDAGAQLRHCVPSRRASSEESLLMGSDRPWDEGIRVLRPSFKEKGPKP